MSKLVPFHFINTMKQVLVEVFEKSKHADRVIDKYLRANPKWTPADRKLFTESVYEIIKNRLLFESLTDNTDLYKTIATYFLKKGFKIPERPEFLGVSLVEIKKLESIKKELSTQYSVPIWLNELGKKQFGQRWENILKSFLEVPKTYIRVNRLKTDKAELIKLLKNESINCNSYHNKNIEIPDCLEIVDNKNIFKTQCYKQGLFEMQDAGSQFISTLLQIEPQLKVLDACSGSGGKSLHIASLLENSGKVVSMDIQSYKLNDLKERAKKAGALNIETQTIDNPKVIKRYAKSFDRVLLDVPCSGLGVLKRNPESKWKLNFEDIKKLNETQKYILQNYSEMCSVDGIMVYSTCSLLKEENEDQLEAFLKSKVGTEWELINEYRLWPDQDKTDGFYAAVMKRVKG